MLLPLLVALGSILGLSTVSFLEKKKKGKKSGKKKRKKGKKEGEKKDIGEPEITKHETAVDEGDESKGTDQA